MQLVNLDTAGAQFSTTVTIADLGAGATAETLGRFVSTVRLNPGLGVWVREFVFSADSTSVALTFQGRYHDPKFERPVDTEGVARRTLARIMAQPSESWGWPTPAPRIVPAWETAGPVDQRSLALPQKSSRPATNGGGFWLS